MSRDEAHSAKRLVRRRGENKDLADMAAADGLLHYILGL
jgi:hypothetical protein